MPQFSYNIISKDGHKSSGLLTSPSREAAVESLRSQGAKPLSVREVNTKKTKFTLSSHKVKLRELVIFTRELSTMIDAGVPLPRGLGTLADQTENKYFKGVISGINRDIESGVPLADAMAKYPNVFSSVYVNMIRAGEAGGILDDILKRLATQVEKDSAIRQKIHSAMAYPVVILTVTVIAFFGIMIFIMPKIAKIINDLGGPGAQLPIYSRIMLSTSAFVQKNIIFILIFSVAVSWAFRRYIKTEKGKYRWHSFLLKLPVLGKIIAKIAIARFSRTFASLMGSGVSVLESLEVTSKAVGNKVIQKELMDVAQAVKNGQPLGKQLSAAPFFPPIVGQMMSVGEETGKIDQILLKVADFYEEEVDAVIDSLASIIEPVMIIILGALVGMIAASVMGPIAGLSKNIGG
ncbi:type II secretion system F family protein [Candidatus Saccharibacteria bacterium]|nr:type II secretion system F family protein [Candidatus Saccharibacteria bacterium]